MQTQAMTFLRLQNCTILPDGAGTSGMEFDWRKRSGTSKQPPPAANMTAVMEGDYGNPNRSLNGMMASK